MGPPEDVPCWSAILLVLLKLFACCEIRVNAGLNAALEAINGDARVVASLKDLAMEAMMKLEVYLYSGRCS
jgi:hypothetical protein